ncbi:GSCOCG00012837001-RA-CDS, partial [Cotesia congregata]
MGVEGLRVLQANLRNDRAGTLEASQLWEEKRIDVLLLQEPYAAYSNNSFKIPGFGCGIQVAAETRSRPYAAVCLTNPKYQLLGLSQLSTTHCVCAQIVGPDTTFFAVSAYFQYKDEIDIHLKHLEKVVRALRGKRVLISMDANAKSERWGSETDDARGEKLEQFIDAHRLEIVNNAREGPTFESTNGSSYIDVTLVMPKIASSILSWSIKRSWVQNTDHYPIEITLGTKSGEEDGVLADPKRFNLTLANWEKFDEILFSCACTNLESLGVESVEDVERYASVLGKSILEACEAAIPRRKTHVKLYPWWTRKLTRAKKLVNKARRVYQRERDEFVKNTLSVKYRTLRKQYSTDIK